jgi:glyoxylase-like metal-dependent hydrolase (beta-lactamase superfamily II)
MTKLETPTGADATAERLHPVDARFPDLYASAPEPLPFAPSLAIRAFLLRREAGNLVVYAASALEAAAPAIEELGGAARQYLNHRHEAMFAPDRASAALFVHEDERPAVSERLHVRAAFSRRHLLDGDFEVIPTPGHTSGATAYLWRSGGHRFLFTGDTILLSDGEWVGAVLDSSDRAAYLESLELIRGLDFDVLVPWAASVGQPPFAVVDRSEARRRIEAMVERLRRGEDH